MQYYLSDVSGLELYVGVCYMGEFILTITLNPTKPLNGIPLPDSLLGASSSLKLLLFDVAKATVGVISNSPWEL